MHKFMYSGRVFLSTLGILCCTFLGYRTSSIEAVYAIAAIAGAVGFANAHQKKGTDLDT